MTTAVSGGGRPRPLPIRPRPVTGESTGSYIRRLAREPSPADQGPQQGTAPPQGPRAGPDRQGGQDSALRRHPQWRRRTRAVLSHPGRSLRCSPPDSAASPAIAGPGSAQAAAAANISTRPFQERDPGHGVTEHGMTGISYPVVRNYVASLRGSRPRPRPAARVTVTSALPPGPAQNAPVMTWSSAHLAVEQQDLARGADPLRPLNGMPVVAEAEIRGHWLAAEIMRAWTGRAASQQDPGKDPDHQRNHRILRPNRSADCGLIPSSGGTKHSRDSTRSRRGAETGVLGRVEEGRHSLGHRGSSEAEAPVQRPARSSGLSPPQRASGCLLDRRRRGA